uniref:Uncharacterized protein n=1 Tax=Cacopsylla melanoneura TaxID=428564 RepID=A0A8D8ZAZ7_9HEMI
MHSDKMRVKHSPIPIGLTPGFFSSAINLHDMRAWIIFEGTCLLHNEFAKSAAASRRWRLALPYVRRKSDHCSELDPPGPAPPCSLRDTFSTFSFVIVTSCRM